MITALAMKYFADMECDIVVLEVGMGGELDSTNVIDTPECAVITSIGLDHTAQLGNTLSQVASAKAGIIKGGTVVSYESNGEAYKVIKEACEQKNAKLITADFGKITNLSSDINGSTFDFGELKGLQIHLAGAYQPYNASLALTALLALRDKGYAISDENIRNGLYETQWSGRFEILGKNPVFILDGAHNPHGMKAAANSFSSLFGEKKIIFITGAMADKDVNGMFSLIVPMSDIFYTLTPDNSRSMKSDELARRLEDMGAKAVSCEKFEEAVSLALNRAGNDGIIAALGSLYFSADIRKAYNSVKGKNNA
jgi:dihydrofolate synthase/folylpolyglutamate synthase